MFSVPLRRALVVDSDLPYPEGRAAAEVLQVGSESREGGAESAAGLNVLVKGSLVSAGFAILTQMKLAAAEAAVWFRAGAGATGIAGGLSFALFGVGHLVGLSVGIAQLVGLATGWWILLPILTAQQPLPLGAEDWATTIFRQDVRFFGAGRDRRRGGVDPAQDRRPGDRRHPLGDARRRRRAGAARRWRWASATCRSGSSRAAVRRSCCRSPGWCGA